MLVRYKTAEGGLSLIEGSLKFVDVIERKHTASLLRKHIQTTQFLNARSGRTISKGNLTLYGEPISWRLKRKKKNNGVDILIEYTQ